MLDALRPDDLPSVHALLTTPVIAEGLGLTADLSLEQVSARFFDAPMFDTQPLVARDSRHGLVGLALLEGKMMPRVRHRASVLVAVNPAFQSRGVGTALLAAAIDHAFQWRGLLRLECDIAVDNPAAKRLAESHGFVSNVSRRGAIRSSAGGFVDVQLYQLERGDVSWPAPGPQPQSHTAPLEGELLVREQRASDAEGLARVYGEPSVCWGTLQLPFATEMTWRTRMEPRPHFLAFTAEIAGRIVGSTGLMMSGSPRYAHVGGFGMGVLPEARGRGVGKALIERVLSHARAQGLRRVELEVFTDNHVARRLYARHGFVSEGVSRADAFRAGGFADSEWMSVLLAPTD